ncbi:Uncharacterised protein (plasmid) [Legionella adelaidensis]|uniref:Uncharacterized protein n=1 Tax=Legionella adelaidensis TaxID=45056 RepID=A0A0W0R2F6_9GAMM|nr:hypothetical protein [Legionella adelaidensis]KTC65252.1 hypothetical protein Lade_1435 [Legionella adelaidensis]VEH86221.1 Uncharacterised protein [Legionella adelaidensis]
MKIRICELSSNKLVIEPISEKKSMYSRDLSIELSDLVSFLNSLGLHQNSDYTRIEGPYPLTQPEYKLAFSGKSLVLRALGRIPMDSIAQWDRGYLDSTRGLDLPGVIQWYALNINSSECFHSELPLVEKAQDAVFKQLKDQINTLHSKITQPSGFIDRLNKEISTLSKRTDQLFEQSNFNLLMAALEKTAQDELDSPSVVEKGFSLFAKKSILYPEYRKLILQFAPLTRGLYRRQTETVGLRPEYKGFEPQLERVRALYQQI